MASILYDRLKKEAVDRLQHAIILLDQFHEPCQAYHSEGMAEGIVKAYKLMTNDDSMYDDTDLYYYRHKLHDLDFEGTPYTLIDADVIIAYCNAHPRREGQNG